MKKAMLVAGVGLLLAGGAALVAQDATTVPAQPARIAVVDLESIFEACQERKQLEGEIFKEFEAKVTVLDNLKAEIEKVKQSMALVKSDSEDGQRYQEELALMTARLKFSDERFQKELADRRDASFEKIYSRIRTEVEKVASDMGIDVVFQRRLTLQERMPSWESVLYARGSLDITGQVVARLNGT